MISGLALDTLVLSLYYPSHNCSHAELLQIFPSLFTRELTKVEGGFYNLWQLCKFCPLLTLSENCSHLSLCVCLFAFARQK